MFWEGVHNSDSGTQPVSELECHDRNGPIWTPKSFRATCHLLFCFHTYKFVYLLWHLGGFRKLLSCQHCSCTLMLSLNYTITLSCTVDLVIKYLKCSSTHRISKIWFESNHLVKITMSQPEETSVHSAIERRKRLRPRKKRPATGFIDSYDNEFCRHEQTTQQLGA